MEIGWVVRDEDGRSRTCEDAGIATVRLRLAPVEGGEAREEGFPCEDGGGATAFDVTPGRYAFSLQPLARDESPLGPAEGVCVPDDLERDVVAGEIADLAVWLIRAVREAEAGGC